MNMRPYCIQYFAFVLQANKSLYSEKNGNKYKAKHEENKRKLLQTTDVFYTSSI